jgi:hypothetical protein
MLQRRTEPGVLRHTEFVVCYSGSARANSNADTLRTALRLICIVIGIASVVALVDDPAQRAGPETLRVRVRRSARAEP